MITSISVRQKYIDEYIRQGADAGMKGNVVLQLGYGMQGEACLADLLKSETIGKVIVADASFEEECPSARFKDPRVVPVKLDARDEKAVLDLMRQADVVIELLPGQFALKMAKLAVKAKVSLVSAMYLFNPGEQDMTKRAAEADAIASLHEEAESCGITILEEFGMDPGMDIVLGRRALDELDEAKVFHSYGAGFPEPKASYNPIRYKFTWSVIGVMRSYLRPARVIKGGRVIDIAADAMFDEENMHMLKLPEFDSPLECFANGDSESFARAFGIRDTISSMGRYICRWPGTGAFWKVMAKCGFLSPDPISVCGAKVAPDVFCAALFGGQRQFWYEDDERDVALIRSDVRGYKDGKPLRVVFQIIDYRDLDSKFTAMQRTVGFPVSIGAQMILSGEVKKKGIADPTCAPFDRYMAELGKRGITFTRHVEEWNGNELP